VSLGDAGPDTGSQDGGDADADGSSSTTPTLVLADPDVTLLGITSDEVVLYQKASTIYAIPLTGGTPELVTKEPYVQREIDGPALFLFSREGDSTTAFTLRSWTKAGGLKTVAPYARSIDAGPSTLLPSTPVNADGSKMAFVALDASGTTGTITTAALDGTGAVALATPPLATCGFGADTPVEQLRFAPNGDLFAWYCVASDGGGQQQSFTYVVGGGAPKTITGDQINVSPDGAYLFDVQPDGSASLVRLKDGVRTALDTGVAPGAVAQVPLEASHQPCLFDATGATVYYVANGALRYASTANPVAATVPGAGAVTTLQRVSPDGAYAAFTSGQPSQLKLVNPGWAAATVLASDATGVGTVFTSDSKYVVLSTSDGTYTAALSSLPIAAPDAGAAQPVKLTGGAWEDLPLSGAEILSPVGTDILVLDASGANPANAIASGLGNANSKPEESWGISADSKEIVYLTSTGIYAVAVK
jgi:hypothetical protein